MFQCECLKIKLSNSNSMLNIASFLIVTDIVYFSLRRLDGELSEGEVTMFLGILGLVAVILGMIIK